MSCDGTTQHFTYRLNQPKGRFSENLVADNDFEDVVEDEDEEGEKDEDEDNIWIMIRSL